ncbi:MAG: hypothetical protein WCK67_11500 [bacterium]
MSGFSGVKTLGCAQSRYDRQVSLSYYKLTKKIESITGTLNSKKSKESNFNSINKCSIESILSSLKISPEEKDLIKDYIETPFFKALTRNKSKEELKEIIKEVAVSLTSVESEPENKEKEVIDQHHCCNIKISSLFDIITSDAFTSKQKFIIQEFSNTLPFFLLFDFHKRIFEGEVPLNIVKNLINDFISELCLYNINNRDDFYKSLNGRNKQTPAQISNLYSKLTFRKSIASLFNYSDLKFKLKIIEELFTEIKTPGNLLISAYDEFEINSGYFKNYWTENSLYSSGEKKAVLSLYIRNEKYKNINSEYSLIQKLLKSNHDEFNEYKTVFQSLGFKTAEILEVMDNEMDDVEFKNIVKNTVNKMIFIESDNIHITDPFKKKIFQKVCLK